MGLTPKNGHHACFEQRIDRLSVHLPARVEKGHVRHRWMGRPAIDDNFVRVATDQWPRTVVGGAAVAVVRQTLRAMAEAGGVVQMLNGLTPIGGVVLVM
jgi:hypothetical protein